MGMRMKNSYKYPPRFGTLTFFLIQRCWLYRLVTNLDVLSNAAGLERMLKEFQEQI